MGTLLTAGSILAAFFAGAVALFSPCCIVFLFPAYLASAVKNRRWSLLPLTLLFALGLGVVLLPITLGVGLLSHTTAPPPKTRTLAVAVGFAAMGVIVLILAVNGNTTATPAFQLAIGRWLSKVFTGITSALEPIPEPVLGLGPPPPA